MGFGLRHSWERATSDIDVTLAELRSVSNDARRHRSGEEKKAAGEFRKVAEDSERLSVRHEYLLRSLAVRSALCARWMLLEQYLRKNLSINIADLCIDTPCAQVWSKNKNYRLEMSDQYSRVKKEES
eukprot:1293869-Amphidinium_carterae.1